MPDIAGVPGISDHVTASMHQAMNAQANQVHYRVTLVDEHNKAWNVSFLAADDRTASARAGLLLGSYQQSNPRVRVVAVQDMSAGRVMVWNNPFDALELSAGIEDVTYLSSVQSSPRRP